MSQRPDMTVSPQWSPDRETRATIADLRERLERSEEELRYLKDALTIAPDIAYEGVFLSKAEKVVMEALFATPHRRLDSTYLRGRLDVALDRRDSCEPKSVDVVICRLRRKLKQLNPPIAIRTEWGVGYFLTEDDRELFALRRHIVPGRQPPQRTGSSE